MEYKNKKIELIVDDAKTNVDKVHMAIAKAGHDTDMHKAKDEVYNELPDAVKYERIEAKHDSHAGHKY